MAIVKEKHIKIEPRICTILVFELNCERKSLNKQYNSD